MRISDFLTPELIRDLILPLLDYQDQFNLSLSNKEIYHILSPEIAKLQYEETIQYLKDLSLNSEIQSKIKELQIEFNKLFIARYTNDSTVPFSIINYQQDVSPTAQKLALVFKNHIADELEKCPLFNRVEVPFPFPLPNRTNTPQLYNKISRNWIDSALTPHEDSINSLAYGVMTLTVFKLNPSLQNIFCKNLGSLAKLDEPTKCELKYLLSLLQTFDSNYESYSAGVELLLTLIDSEDKKTYREQITAIRDLMFEAKKFLEDGKIDLAGKNVRQALKNFISIDSHIKTPRPDRTGYYQSILAPLQDAISELPSGQLVHFYNYLDLSKVNE